MGRYKAEYDFFKDGEYVMTGTSAEIAKRVGRSVVTVQQWAKYPPRGVLMVRSGWRR